MSTKPWGYSSARRAPEWHAGAAEAIHLATLEKVIAAVGDIVRFGDDLGMDRGPLISPDTHRTPLKAHHAALNAYVHRNSPMRTFLHSCGSIHRLLPDLIEAGYDIINPVLITAKDMEPEWLKRDFGAEVTFWGGRSRQPARAAEWHALGGEGPRATQNRDIRTRWRVRLCDGPQHAARLPTGEHRGDVRGDR